MRIFILLRIIGTAIVFTLISVGGFCLSILIFPLVSLFSSNEHIRAIRCQRIIHYTFRVVVFIMRCFHLVKLELVNSEKNQNNEGVLYIANHPTLIDYVYLTAIFPQLDFIVKEDVWNDFFLGGVVKAAGYLRVDDPMSFEENCLKHLEAGRNILIFPEGTRSLPHELQKFKKGAAALACSTTCKVQIITITCKPPILMKHQKWHALNSEIAVMNIKIHGEIDIKDIAGDKTSKITKQILVNDFLKETIKKEVYE